MRRYVGEGVPIGLLGYSSGQPVAWCSIAPRTTYRDLGGPTNISEFPEEVWSLVCFFIRRDLRGKGLTKRIIEAAVQHAAKRGAKVVEAYPVEPGSPSYRFMGLCLPETQKRLTATANRLILAPDERSLQVDLVRLDRIFPIAGCVGS